MGQSAISIHFLNLLIQKKKEKIKENVRGYKRVRILNQKKQMKEFIYHALGICGEHSHPHLLNVGYILLATFILYKIVKLKSRLNG